MRCEQVQSLLSAYTDGELPQILSGRVAAHLAACEACAAESQSLSSLVQVLRDLPEEDLPEELHGAILHALDAARPSLWQRFCALTVPLQPARQFAYGTAAAALAVLVVSTAPLHHARRESDTAASVPVRIAARPIVVPPVDRVSAPEAVQDKEPAPASDPASPTVAGRQTLPDAATTLADGDARPTGRVRLAQATPLPRGTAARPNASATAGTKEPSAPRSGEPAVMPTFDPLATVMDASPSPADPPMTHIVVVDMPEGTDPSDGGLLAAMPGAPERETASAGDDLASLRQRLAEETFEIPKPRLETRPRPRKSKVIPLLHSEF